jgi:alpha-ribazole phosphatase
VPALRWEGSQLVLVRHAPVAEPGILCGRTDLPARIDSATIAPLAELLSDLVDVVTSPARRCRQTARAIWPEASGFEADARLWEQDFGDDDGRRFSDLPDLGTLSGAELAAHRPPGGESFDDLCARTRPALREAAERARTSGEPIALVVHAGVIRAALALVLGSRPAALTFEIAPLSITRTRVGPEGPVSIIETNRVHV